MRPIRRRKLLEVGAVVGASAFAGCATSGEPDKVDDGAPTSPESPAGQGGDETSSPTGAATDGVDDLSYSAGVRDQQSSSTPATIRTELTNNSESRTTFGARETIVLGYGDGPGNWILPFPETNVGPNDPPTEANDGCWRYTDEYFHARDEEVWHTIEAGRSFQETYRLFTWGDDRTCLPEGDYRFSATIRDEEENELQVILEITISNGHVSVDASDQAV